jgi:hypothetical protein
MTVSIHSHEPVPPYADDRDWARGVLGVPAGETADQTRAAMLARLEEAEFVPPPQWEQAILLLVDDPPDEMWARLGGKEMLDAREAALKGEVDQFALEFFALPLARRHARWRELTEKCAASLPLTTRLEALVDGLGVESPPVQGEPLSAVDTLIDEICKAFVLPPSMRAAKHKEIHLRASADPRQWQRIGRELSDRWPQVTPLAPKLLENLCDYVRVRKAAVKAARREAKQQVARSSVKNKKKVSLGAIGGIVALLAFCVGILTGHNPNDQSRFLSSKYPNSTRSSQNDTNKVNAEFNRLRKAWMKDQKNNVLPPRDPNVFIGDSINQGKYALSPSFRSLLSIPESIEVFVENGQFVFRQKPAHPLLDPLNHLKPEPPIKNNY